MLFSLANILLSHFMGNPPSSVSEFMSDSSSSTIPLVRSDHIGLPSTFRQNPWLFQMLHLSTALSLAPPCSLTVHLHLPKLSEVKNELNSILKHFSPIIIVSSWIESIFTTFTTVQIWISFLTQSKINRRKEIIKIREELNTIEYKQ